MANKCKDCELEKTWNSKSTHYRLTLESEMECRKSGNELYFQVKPEPLTGTGTAFGMADLLVFYGPPCDAGASEKKELKKPTSKPAEYETVKPFSIIDLARAGFTDGQVAKMASCFRENLGHLSDVIAGKYHYEGLSRVIEDLAPDLEKAGFIRRKVPELRVREWVSHKDHGNGRIHDFMPPYVRVAFTDVPGRFVNVSNKELTPITAPSWPDDGAAGMTECVKPPIGIVPPHIWKRHRIFDLLAAFKRYSDANVIPPLEWSKELGELSEGVGEEA